MPNAENSFTIAEFFQIIGLDPIICALLSYLRTSQLTLQRIFLTSRFTDRLAKQSTASL